MARGELWQVDLKTGAGHEQEGRRPAILVGCKVADIIVVIPVTSNLHAAKFPYTEIIDASETNGLTEVSVALVFQMRAISSGRLIRRIGTLSPGEMERIDAQMIGLLQLPKRS